jgi:hypothetical protein
MKEYGDERFIYGMALESEAVEEEETDIRKGYAFIGGERVLFCEREIGPDGLFVTLPSEFGLMDLDTAKLKYPNEDRPGVIYADGEGATTYNFSFRDEEMDDGETEEVRDAILAVMKRLNPSYGFMAVGVTRAEGTRIGFFDFVSPAVDSDVYNLLFIFSLRGRLVLGSFNCLHADMAAWTEVNEQVLKYIRC